MWWVRISMSLKSQTEFIPCLIECYVSELGGVQFTLKIYFELKTRSHWCPIISSYVRPPVHSNLYTEDIVYSNVTFSTLFILKTQLIQGVSSENHCHFIISLFSMMNGYPTLIKLSNSFQIPTWILSSYCSLKIKY